MADDDDDDDDDDDHKDNILWFQSHRGDSAPCGGGGWVVLVSL